MKKSIVLISVLIGATVLFGAKAAVLDGLKRPFFIKVDENRFYITDGPTVSIYSLKDHTLINRFGKEGEGPQEFKLDNRNARGVMIALTEDKIVVNSVGRVSFFTKDGKYLGEKQTGGSGTRFQPVGDGKYVGEGFGNENNINYSLRHLYDPDFKRGPELYKRESFFQPKGALNAFYFFSPIVEVYQSKIFINGVDNQVYVFDNTGKKLYTITFEHEKIKIADEYKERVHEWHKTYPEMRRFYDMIKDRLTFPAYFPGIRMFNVADGKVYILTYKKKGKNSEFVVLDIKGNPLKRGFVHFAERDLRTFAPYTIKNGKLYQLVETDDNEAWELHITDISFTAKSRFTSKSNPPQ